MKIAVLTGYFPPKLTQTYSLVEMEAFEKMGFEVYVFPMSSQRVSQNEGIQTLSTAHLKLTSFDLPEQFESPKNGKNLIHAILNNYFNKIRVLIETDKYLKPHSESIFEALRFIRLFPKRLEKAKTILQRTQSEEISKEMSEKHEIIFLQSILIGHNMAKNGIQVAYAQNAAKVGLSAFFASIFSGQNSVCVVQGHNNDTTILSYPERLLRLEADIVTVDSNGSLQPFVEAIDHAVLTKQIDSTQGAYLKEKIQVIPRGIKLDLFTSLDSFTRNHHKRDGSEFNELRLIAIARPIEKKGIHYLIAALNILKNETTLHFKLTYIGDEINRKELLEELKHFAQEQGVYEHIEFLGYKPQIEIQKELINADIHIAPFVRLEQGQTDDVDGLARSILEAAAMKVPTIGTDVGGTADFINDQNGILVEQRNAKAIADAILVLAQPEKRNRLANQAYDDVQKKYDYATAQISLLPLIENALGDKKYSDEDNTGYLNSRIEHPKRTHYRCLSWFDMNEKTGDEASPMPKRSLLPMITL